MKNNFFFHRESLFFDKEFTISLLKEFNKIFSGEKFKLSLSNVCELKSNSISKNVLLKSTLNKVYEKFKLITGEKDLVFNKLWMVSSKSENTNKTILPYIPHFDKSRYLKAMVYIHDVTIEHGPIYLGKVNKNINIEERRIKLPSDYADKSLNCIQNQEIDGTLIPMLGNAGDIIFFDTNTPHKGGIIKNEYFRKVLRFDFERPSFNPKKNIFQRLKKFIS